MNIVALSGSPRKNGNTEILINEFFKGANEKGHTTELIRLYPLKINPCVDCQKCKIPAFECAVKDNMNELYSKIESADIIVFGTPIYWYGPTAKMKLFIDRLRPYIANKKLAGKKGILIIPSEEGPGACITTVNSFIMSFKYINMKYLGVIYGTAYNKGEILKNKIEIEYAYNFGKNIN